MKNEISRKEFSIITEHTARSYFKSAGIDHTYGIASSVCGLLCENISSSDCNNIGIITMNDIGLNKDNFYTLEDVIKTSQDNGYLKITPSDALAYLIYNSGYRLNGSVVVMMDEVVDGEGDEGVIFINSDEEGFLHRVGFFKPDKSKKLSIQAKFLVGKK